MTIADHQRPLLKTENACLLRCFNRKYVSARKLGSHLRALTRMRGGQLLQCDKLHLEKELYLHMGFIIIAWVKVR